jgi:predicted ATPase
VTASSPPGASVPSSAGRLVVPVLERDAALHALRAALDHTRAGTGRVVLLAGEAGIGKTTVVRTWTAELAAGREVRVLTGACDDLVTPGRSAR